MTSSFCGRWNGMFGPLVSGFRSGAIIAPSTHHLHSRCRSGGHASGDPTRGGQGEKTMSERPIHYRSLVEVSARIRGGESTSAEVTRALLDRIAALDGNLRAYSVLMADSAMAAAEAADAEVRRREGPGPAPRGAGGGEGPLPDEGGTDPRGDAPVERLRAGLRQHRGRAVPRGGGGPARQARAHRGSVRLPSPRRRRPGEPVEPGVLAGRLVERLGGRDGRGALLRIARLRHRGVDPVPLARPAR